MAQSVIRYTQAFARYFDQLVARDKLYRVAVIATANKLLRVIFALLMNLTPFHNNLQPKVSDS